MTAPLTDVIDITLTESPTPVSQPGFGIGLFLATHHYWVERVRTYLGTAGMAADGIPTTDPIYKAGLIYFSQSPAPKKMKIGRRSADVVNIAIVAVNSFLYSVKINGVAYTYTSDGSATQAEIGAGLIASYNSAVSGLVMTYSTGVLTLTGTTDLAFSVTALSSHLTMSALTASATAAHDLDAIANVDSDFYGVASADRDSSSMQAVAAWALANNRICFAASQEANIVDEDDNTDTTTLIAVEKAASVKRISVIYSEDTDTAYPDVAEMSRALGLPPGAYDLDLKELAGITVSSLTATQRQNALSKNCNIYEIQGDGKPGMRRGTVADGHFVDQIHGRDWFMSQLGIFIFTALRAPTRVPFTEAGISVIKNQIMGALAAGVASGYIADGTTSVLMPALEDVSDVDKGNRLLSGIAVNYTESGSIQKVAVNLSVKV